MPLWKIRSSQKKKKHWQDSSEKEQRKEMEKSLFLEFGKKTLFFAAGDSWLYGIQPSSLTLSSLSDKLLAPLSAQMGRFLDWEAEGRCLMNWGDLADVWPFPGALRTDGLFSFTALVIYSATALSHMQPQDPMLSPLHSPERIPLDVTVSLLLLALLEVSLRPETEHAKTVKSVFWKAHGFRWCVEETGLKE